MIYTFLNFLFITDYGKVVIFEFKKKKIYVLYKGEKKNLTVAAPCLHRLSMRSLQK